MPLEAAGDSGQRALAGAERPAKAGEVGSPPARPPRASGAAPGADTVPAGAGPSYWGPGGDRLGFCFASLAPIPQPGLLSRDLGTVFEDLSEFWSLSSFLQPFFPSCAQLGCFLLLLG